jgi:hypothetical protein
MADAQAVQEAGVDADRLVWQQAILDLMAQLLWDIKELVWRLGYTQGYHYGAHDGHDLEIKQEIENKKDEFEAAIAATYQLMYERVASELALADERYDAARAELAAAIADYSAQLSADISAALASMQATVDAESAAVAAETARAEAALYAFIQARLAAW